mmetsp:Transcript_15458/g.13990  ORF Transcript_15458/g.13990 Transcript_15458/m.13990 type:complete len:169 (-) Transcript_15458:2-508(-)
MSKLDIEIGGITSANVQQLKTINTSTLPVRYTDKFYYQLISNGNSDYMKFAIWNGFTVGAICGRLESPDENSTNKRLYIMTLNVLPAYRRRGIATNLLKHLLNQAIKDKNIIDVYLHVQISNEDALEFYKYHGFTNVGMIENYYKRIDPPHGYILQISLDDYKSIKNK